MLDTLRTLLQLDGEQPDGTRRTVLAGAPLAAVALGTATTAIATRADAAVRAEAKDRRADEDGFIHFADEREKFRALFRLERDLRDEGTTLSTYQFVTYIVPHGERAQPVVRWEGMEYSYFRRVGDLTWRIHAHNVSFPRDLATGDFTSTARNPFTGETLEIAPMKLLGDPGTLHGPKGYLSLLAREVTWRDTYHLLRREGELVKSEHIRPGPPTWPKIFIESMCNTVSRRDFYDPAVTAIPYQTSGFYLFPFPEWAAMGDTPGHMLGSWSGRRVTGGVGDLPREFRERVARENPDLLAPRWQVFEPPLSPLLKDELKA
ncbi:MAG: hypothetical protein R3E65_00330 [Steroidobacteraceae bacterium]